MRKCITNESQTIHIEEQAIGEQLIDFLPGITRLRGYPFIKRWKGNTALSPTEKIVNAVGQSPLRRSPRF